MHRVMSLELSSTSTAKSLSTPNLVETFWSPIWVTSWMYLKKNINCNLDCWTFGFGSRWICFLCCIQVFASLTRLSSALWSTIQIVMLIVTFVNSQS